MTAELTDDELLFSFETARLGKDAFGHREHVRAAFVYLTRYPDLAEGALRFRRALKRFAAAHGLDHVYHETLTWAYLVLVHDRAQAVGAATSQAFLDACPELLHHRTGLLARYYDVSAVTGSPLARRVFLLPGDERLRADPGGEERR